TAQENEICLFPYRIDKNNNANFLATLELNKFDFVILSGGDGTLNTTINFLLKNNYNLPIGIIPAGTCNDFASSLGIPTNLVDCLKVIFSGKTLAVDLGLINDDLYFLNTCAGGLFVDVSFNTADELKRNFGPLAYYLKALGEVAHKKFFPLKITTESECLEVNALLFCILNGTHGGGFSNLLKDADISDGLMDIIIIKNCYHIDLANLFFRVLSQESLNNKNALRIKAKECFIEGPNDVYLSIDGEKGPSLPVQAKFLHKTLKVFVP
ncbi:MAG: YegS/Rv2252/BmrU family lipid kinase, partial [Clostridia bacterium]|nr:YegS/Rv2252/BmrU family lipid kinase [Clostridia bacterium]